MNGLQFPMPDGPRTVVASVYGVRPREGYARAPGTITLPPLKTSTSTLPSPAQASPGPTFRRKPLPQGASPLALGPASGERVGLATGTLRDPPRDIDREGDRFSEVDLSESAGNGLGRPPRSHPAPGAGASHALQNSRQRGSSRQGQESNHVRLASGPARAERMHGDDAHQGADVDDAPAGRQRSATVAVGRSPRSHPLKLSVEGHSRDGSGFSEESMYSNAASKPRSPTSNLPSIFEGKGSSAGAASSVTSFSTLPSPRSPKFSSAPLSSTPPRPVPSAIDVRKANAGSPYGSSAEQEVDVPISDPAIVEQVDAMEEELREISSELASSIRREMELEDLVDQLRSESGHDAERGRRTSDYFSDTGTSSRDGDAKDMELEKLQRKAEQEKAQLRLKLTQKIQSERLRRKALENQVRKLDERGQKFLEPKDISADVTGRVKQLEASIEETRRRLSEERRMKENYEDLLTALRAEIEEYRNERDNLRDEVVPQLQTRVEGLEAEAAELQRLRYEDTRAQQQKLQSLRESQAETLSRPRKASIGMAQPSPTFDIIAEEDPSMAESGPLNSSLNARPRAPQSRRTSLSRSNSVRERETRDSLADRVKDIEAQRDALHQALRSLLDRHEHQNREHAKRVQALELERDRALSGAVKKGYDREVSNLRDEINHLRRRADEALEQKWQCEKGLGGLKMDLDRAEQETSSLRTLLLEHDIMLPESSSSSSASLSLESPTLAAARARSGSITSASLEKAYRELQSTHALALARIETLERGELGVTTTTTSLAAANAETSRTMQLLKQSISDAEAERDVAQRQAEEFRLEAESLREAGKEQQDEEHSLSEQLRASAVRVEELAVQVRQQLESNQALRHRLADAIARGERQQRTSAARITEMQGKLKSLEEQLTVAQQHTEDTVARHEDEVREIRESHNAQLQRMKSGFKLSVGGNAKSLASPLSISLASSPRKGSLATTANGGGAAAAGGGMITPGFPLAIGTVNGMAISSSSPLFSARSPRLDLTSTGVGMSMMELSKTDFLEHRVEDLERALSDADREMGEVVSRMNMAQIEVMELQSQRDEAMRQTRKLQSDIDHERQRVYALMR